MVEIEKCRNDIKKLREEMVSRNNRCARSDSTETHHKLACVSPALSVLSELKCCCFFLFFSTFSNFLEDNKKLTPRRDVPSYPKVSPAPSLAAPGHASWSCDSELCFQAVAGKALIISFFLLSKNFF